MKKPGLVRLRMERPSPYPCASRHANHHIGILSPAVINLGQIIYNLVYNCAQHTPKGATINISAKYEVDADYDTHIDLIKKCVITISDDGYGFPPEEIDKAFDKFYRLPNTKTGGSGLGLSIVKGFVEAQNGIITLENRPDKGAKFTIQIRTEVSYLNDIENEQV